MALCSLYLFGLVWGVVSPSRQLLQSPGCETWWLEERKKLSHVQIGHRTEFLALRHAPPTIVVTTFSALMWDGIIPDCPLLFPWLTGGDRQCLYGVFSLNFSALSLFYSRITSCCWIWENSRTVHSYWECSWQLGYYCSLSRIISCKIHPETVVRVDF